MPVIIYCAFTAPINPLSKSALSTITREQVWKALQRKIRKAEDFVSVFERTEVLEDHSDEVTRVAYYKGEQGRPGKVVKQVCKAYYPSKVDFHMPNGAVITNTVSDGEGPNDLYMTYSFEYRHPEVTEGSEEHETLAREHMASAKDAVISSISTIRKMRELGELD